MRPNEHETLHTRHMVWETEGWHEGSDGVEGCAQERTNSGGVRGGLIWKEEYGLVSAAKEYTRDERR